MRQRAGIVALILAVVFGAMGSATAYVYLNRQPPKPDEQSKFESVVVAAKDLTFGTELAAENLRTVFYPRESVPDGAFSDPDTLIGQTLKVFVSAKEPIVATKLTSVGGGLSIRIPANMRATSMNVNVASGVSGFVLPGDRVDVLTTIDRRGSRDAVTRTILQDVEVLAAGQKTNQKNDRPVKVQVVTLLVDPSGAEKLALAMHEGELHLVLRNPGDRELAKTQGITTGSIVNDKPKRTVRRSSKPVVKAPERTTVTVIRGVEVKEQEPPVESPKDQNKS